MSSLYLRLGRACNWLGARLLDAEEWLEARAMRAEALRRSRELTVRDRTHDCDVAAAIRFGGNFWVRHTSETTPEGLAMQLSQRAKFTADGGQFAAELRAAMGGDAK